MDFVGCKFIPSLYRTLENASKVIRVVWFDAYLHRIGAVHKVCHAIFDDF